MTPAQIKLIRALIAAEKEKSDAIWAFRSAFVTMSGVEKRAAYDEAREAVEAMMREIER